jgi:HSP20 family molecular chaperone IbpA
MMRRTMAQQDPNTWMWERAREMLEKMDKLQRHFFELRRSRHLRPTWEPPVDIFESESELWILVALPGVEPERLEVLIESGVLLVAGERSLPSQFRRAEVHRMEIPHGRFEREIELPEGRFELGDRQLLNGCLFLSLKKKGPYA